MTGKPRGRQNVSQAGDAPVQDAAFAGVGDPENKPLLRDSSRRRSSGCTCALLVGAGIAVALAATAFVMWLV